MKAIRLIIIFCLLLLLLLFLPAVAEKPGDVKMGNIILFTGYRQMGWGDRVEIGCLDDQGQAFVLNGHDSNLKWPYKAEDQLAYLESCQNLTCIGKIAHSDLFSIQSLIDDTEDQGSAAYPAACDAGTEKTYAVRRSHDGSPALILLGMSGDDSFENMDPDAQSLYWCARQLFRNVTSYAYQGTSIGPQGFSPVSLLEFLGVSSADIRQASIKASVIDCEAGPIDTVLSNAEETQVRNFILTGTVIRKANALSTTGGFTVYSFTQPDGTPICSISLCEGLLITRDGMYQLTK